MLYDVDLLTGAASAVGPLSDLTTTDLAIRLGPAVEPLVTRPGLPPQAGPLRVRGRPPTLGG